MRFVGDWVKAPPCWPSAWSGYHPVWYSGRNFSTANPSRAYMEAVFDWRLEYRTPDELIALATEAGVKRERITVESEPAGVNLFLTIQA